MIRASRSVVAVVFAVACIGLGTEQVFAAFVFRPVGVGQDANGVEVAHGYREGDDEHDAKFKSIYPYPPPTGSQEKVQMHIDICCNTCPSSCTLDCCVQYTDVVWRVKDKNQVSGPTNSMGSGNSCSPCEECLTIMIDAATGPNAGNGYPQGWSYPASELVFEVKSSNCKCCETSTSSDVKSATYYAQPLDEEE